MMWQSPVPQSRPPTGATLPGSPESTAAASVRASVAMSKSHPVVTEVSDDGMDLVPPATRSKKGIVIAGVVAVAVAGGALFFLRGGFERHEDGCARDGTGCRGARRRAGRPAGPGRRGPGRRPRTGEAGRDCAPGGQAGGPDRRRTPEARVARGTFGGRERET